MSNSMLWVVDVALPRPIDHPFTYSIDESQLAAAQKGIWAQVPFGRATILGIIVSEPKQIDPKFFPGLKSLLKLGPPDEKIPQHVYDLCIWSADYYQSPLGEMLSMAIPLSSMEKEVGRRAKKGDGELEGAREIQLNDEQTKAVELLNSNPQSVILLHGVTGSGKTEVYIERAKKVLDEGRGVIVLVPEIALTPMLEKRISLGLGQPIAVLHSALSAGERRDYWLKLKSGELRVAVGARSALFAPIHDCGLIVVDEEHDSSYKQEERARYQARDLAVVRGKKESAQVVLGSATPSLETLERSIEGRFLTAYLKNRIINRPLPEIQCVDLTAEELVMGMQAPFAAKTLEKIQNTLQRGEKVMIFLNRRGFASYLTCEDCGSVKECPSCSLSLTFHKKKKELRCHTCDHVEKAPDTCFECRGESLLPVGAGTESLEEELPKLIPEMKALRLDRDQITSQTRLKKVLNDFEGSEFNTLMGTQMLVKGHDFSEVTLVVVVLADGLFRWPDFRANERAYQMLVQVSGRAGRGEKRGEVWIQTFDIEHPVLKVVTGQTSEKEFYDIERELRKELSYPPFSRLLRLRFEGDSDFIVKSEAEWLSNQLESSPFKDQIQILGPSAPVIEKVRGMYRMDLFIKSSQIQWIHKVSQVAKKLTKNIKSTLLVDVDPYGVS